MLETKHHLLPIILAIYLPVSFIITYAMAVAYGHVEPGFPYISDTGTFPPESCVFGQLLNLGAALCCIIVYIRYRHVYLKYNEYPGGQGIIHLNTAAFVIGLTTNLGVSIVGNFQETSVIVVHLIGAFMAFGIGFVYCLLQTILSYKLSKTDVVMPGNTQNMRRFRASLCVIDVALLLILSVASGVAIRQGPGGGIPTYLWTSSDPGYAPHLVSTISEWLMAIVTTIYFGTFYTEFKHFRVKPPEVIYYDYAEVNEGYQEEAVSTIS